MQITASEAAGQRARSTFGAADLREVILGAHEDPEGRKILGRMRIERFVPIADSAYDSVREMQAWLAGRAPAR